jgi:hypothetical protein
MPEKVFGERELLLYTDYHARYLKKSILEGKIKFYLRKTFFAGISIIK